MTNCNIEVENEYSQWEINTDEISKIASDLLSFYMNSPDLSENSCLNGYKYDRISFDILFCDGVKTHLINKEYRQKDYPADIITFAVFADSPEDEKFVLDMEINLGEVIIALDKIKDSASEKQIDNDTELKFMISHGIMHLLGFDHQTESDFEFVVKWQKKALESMGIKYDKI